MVGRKRRSQVGLPPGRWEGGEWHVLARSREACRSPGPWSDSPAPRKSHVTPHATPRISPFNTADCLPHLHQRPFGPRSVRFGAHLRPLGQHGGGPARDDGARFASRRITDAACRGWIHGLVASNRRVCGMAGTYLPGPRNCVCRHRTHCLGMSSIAL